jgi:hypothetical protein
VTGSATDAATKAVWSLHRVSSLRRDFIPSSIERFRREMSLRLPETVSEANK